MPELKLQRSQKITEILCLILDSPTSIKIPRLFLRICTNFESHSSMIVAVEASKFEKVGHDLRVGLASKILHKC